MPLKRSIALYDNAKAQQWNAFNGGSLNGTFLLHRSFMDYHAERFEDRSLIISEYDNVVGLLPASKHGSTIISHGGLTYGGLIVGKSKSSAEAIFISLSEACRFLHSQGYTSLFYKPTPHMYHNVPCEADLYALFRLGAKILKRDLSSALPPFSKPQLRKGRKALIQRAKKNPTIQIFKSVDWHGFHALLKARLQEKYGVCPVHSAAELELLASRFPEQIVLTIAMQDNVMISGCVTFHTSKVVHAQYLATSETARENGAMDLLIFDLIQSALAQNKWFDFGISTTNNGQDLNVDLARYKEGFGAKSVIYDCYRIDF